jgi:hypothetical protein
VTDDEWSGTVEMFLGLDADPYNYDGITDNLWLFQTTNRGKENEYIQFSISVSECPRRSHRPTQDTSALAVKSGRETHTVRLSLGGYFVGVDVFFSETVVYICTLFSHL